jgi:hypothetical protein
MPKLARAHRIAQSSGGVVDFVYLEVAGDHWTSRKRGIGMVGCRWSLCDLGDTC